VQPPRLGIDPLARNTGPGLIRSTRRGHSRCPASPRPESPGIGGRIDGLQPNADFSFGILLRSAEVILKANSNEVGWFSRVPDSPWLAFCASPRTPGLRTDGKDPD